MLDCKLWIRRFFGGFIFRQSFGTYGRKTCPKSYDAPVNESKRGCPIRVMSSRRMSYFSPFQPQNRSNPPPFSPPIALFRPYQIPPTLSNGGGNPQYAMWITPTSLSNWVDLIPQISNHRILLDEMEWIGEPQTNPQGAIWWIQWIECIIL